MAEVLMAAEETCKQSLDFSVPAAEVESETNQIVESLREKVRLPGFRPGKVPASMIRSRFADEIKHDVLEKIIPRVLQERFAKESFTVVGSPDIKDLKFEKGEPLSFRAEFETLPQFELGDYRDLTVTYREPEVSDEDVDRRLESLQEQKAEYINVDPRPAADGDHAVVALESLGGLDDKPIQQEEVMLAIGSEDTLPDFTANLQGMEPGQEKEFDVAYPEDYGERRLAGKTIRFHCRLTAIRRKELPEINDDFAQDLGDYQDLAELREAVRSSLMSEREFLAQHEAKNELLEKLVEDHDFPLPEAMVERQIESNIQQRMQELAAQGVDPRGLQIDWKKARETQGERAQRDLKASMLLDRISDREAIEVTQDDVEAEVQRIARQERQPAPALRKRLEEEGQIGRIASRIRTEKTLNLLFEQARKVAPTE